MCFFPKTVTNIADYLFETLNLLAPFPYHLLLCFFSPCLGENPASACFQGNPTKWTLDSFGWVELKIILFVLFPEILDFPLKQLIFPDEGVLFNTSKSIKNIEFIKKVHISGGDYIVPISKSISLQNSTPGKFTSSESSETTNYLLVFFILSLSLNMLEGNLRFSMFFAFFASKTCKQRRKR